MTNKMCPACGSIMNWNTEGLAKNKKAPHWKCSNRDCKRVFDKSTGEWLTGQYRTGVWATPEEIKNQSINQFASGLNQDIKDKQIKEMHDEKQDSITLSVAKNNATLIICELIKLQITGMDYVEEWNKWVDIIYKKQAPKEIDEPDQPIVNIPF